MITTMFGFDPASSESDSAEATLAFAMMAAVISRIGKNVVFIDSLLFSNVYPFLQPSADRLVAFCYFDIDDLLVFKQFPGLRHETNLWVHARHIRLPGEDE